MLAVELLSHLVRGALELRAISGGFHIWPWLSTYHSLNQVGEQPFVSPQHEAKYDKASQGASACMSPARMLDQAIWGHSLPRTGPDVYMAGILGRVLDAWDVPDPRIMVYNFDGLKARLFVGRLTSAWITPEWGLGGDGEPLVASALWLCLQGSPGSTLILAGQPLGEILLQNPPIPTRVSSDPSLKQSAIDNL